MNIPSAFIKKIYTYTEEKLEPYNSSGLLLYSASEREHPRGLGKLALCW